MILDVFMMIDEAHNDNCDDGSCDSNSEYITPLIMFGVITYACMKVLLRR